MPKPQGVQISLNTLLQILATVVLSYMLNQLLGMEAKVKALEVRVEAQQDELDRQAVSIKDLWAKKLSKEAANVGNR